ncbi:MAG: hypothetical protein IIC18_02425 [Bacteroidetes bacterium]|nr:hypothetical protein [Bacteroidota bacterium]
MKAKLPLIIIGILAVVFVILLSLQPRSVDWRPDLRRDSDNALGAEIFAELLPQLLADANGEEAKLTPILDPPFIHLGDESLEGTTYLFLTNDFSPDEAETLRLYEYAERGNTVFIAAQSITGALADTLGIPADSANAFARGLDYRYRGFLGQGDSTLHLVAPVLAKDEGYAFSYEVGNWVMAGLDTARTTVIGTSLSGEPTLVLVEAGEGMFLISSTPYAFGNAAFTGDGSGTEYVAGVLGYLPSQPVFWDTYYKPFANQAQTPLRYILREPPLKWALRLMLLGVLLFIVFRGRRWQRAVPVVAAPVNATLDFVRTVGRLYFQDADHSALVDRKLRYFFDRIRTRLGLTEVDLSEETERRVVARTGLSTEHIARLFARFRRLRRSRTVDPKHLVELDRSLDRFYESVGR